MESSLSALDFQLPVEAERPEEKLKPILDAVGEKLVFDTEEASKLKRVARNTVKQFTPKHRIYLPLLAKAMGDYNPEVRFYASRAIRRIGGDLTEITPTIAAAATHPDWAITSEAILLLCKIGGNLAETIPGIAKLAIAAASPISGPAISLLSKYGNQNPSVALPALRMAARNMSAPFSHNLKAFLGLIRITGSLPKALISLLQRPR